MDSFAWDLFDVFVIVLLVVGATCYAAAAWESRRRGRWPPRRLVAWYAGLACAAVALIGPISTAAHTSFTAHMVGHLLLGMAAPLLLVLGTPVTLALRSLPTAKARFLVRLLRSPLARIITHPVVAAALNAGGLWALYTTWLYGAMHTSAVLHAVVHIHIFVVGYLFTAALIGRDPDPHRASVLVRAAVLLVFIAAHSVLAKWTYAHPPAGVSPSDAEVGAQLMYYGGDLIDILLIVLLLSGWYRATRPRESRPLPTAR